MYLSSSATIVAFIQWLRVKPWLCSIRQCAPPAMPAVAAAAVVTAVTTTATTVTTAVATTAAAEAGSGDSFDIGSSDDVGSDVTNGRF